MKLLFVASIPLEFSHLRRPADEVRTVANGAGAHRAAAGIDEALTSFRPDVMVSMGFCGALDPSLKIAEIVVGTTVFAVGRGRIGAAATQ